ncbi:MAG: hypothetical protein LBR18_00500 [Tannerella sp.]|jgi:hypothetical protein|nr:hypothetical protein [Tannerella sp.]
MIAKVVTKTRLCAEQNDLAYWKSQTPLKRLEALEEIRTEYNNWKYGSEQGFQRVYRIIKRT